MKVMLEHLRDSVDVQDHTLKIFVGLKLSREFMGFENKSHVVSNHCQPVMRLRRIGTVAVQRLVCCTGYFVRRLFFAEKNLIILTLQTVALDRIKCSITFLQKGAFTACTIDRSL